MRTIEYRGVEVAYDETRPLSWKWNKALASGDQARGMRAISDLLCGRDDEYADELGDSMEDMQGLLFAVLDDVREKSAKAKN